VVHDAYLGTRKIRAPAGARLTASPLTVQFIKDVDAAAF